MVVREGAVFVNGHNFCFFLETVTGNIVHETRHFQTISTIFSTKALLVLFCNSNIKTLTLIFIDLKWNIYFSLGLQMIIVVQVLSVKTIAG